MVSSMTGFGRGKHEDDYSSLTVEVRSVNHRYNDISIKTPKSICFLEDRIRRYVQSRITRGRVDVYVSCDMWGLREQVIKVDKRLALNYYEALRGLKDITGYRGDIPFFLTATFPDVVTVKPGEICEEETWEKLEAALVDALDLLIDMRRQEGENLKRDILLKLEALYNGVSEIEKRTEFVVEEHRERLGNRLKELALGADIDGDRVYQEVLIFADRSNIDEEIIRLRSHVAQMRDIFDKGGVIGRQSEFLIQEMNREINTIGSKANDLYISKAVIEMKSQIEKIREQIQNIE